MFYDIEILNRRGGKFGVIWLAANQKLKLTGKGSKNDLRLALKVNVGKICKDIRRYIIVHPERRLLQDKSPRFSLYLSAMLCHGAIVVHHRQVKHYVAYFKLKCQRKPEVNLGCDVNIDLHSSPQVFSNKTTLAELEFGQLEDVLHTLGVVRVVQEQQNVTITEIGPELSTPQRIASDFTEELEAAFNDVHNDPNGHFVSESDITLKEVEVQNIEMQELVEEGFGDTVGIPCWPNPFATGIEPMEEESVENRDLKRLHPSGDESLSQGTPRKQNRMDEGAGGNKIFILAKQSTQIKMELEPLEEPDQGRQGEGRRRRLKIDKEIAIPMTQIEDQVRDYSDTLCPGYGICLPARFRAGTAKELLLRPSCALRGPLAEIVARNMKIKPMEDEFEAAPEMLPPQGNKARTQLVHDSTILNVGLPNAVSSDHFSGQQNIQSIDLHPMGKMEESAYATLSEMATSNAEMIVPVQNVENEILRRGLSTENSFAGSITATSTSRIDVSNHEKSHGSPIQLPERNPVLETVKEATFEASVQSSRKSWSSALNGTAPATATPERHRANASRAPVTPRYEPIPESSLVDGIPSPCSERDRPPVPVPGEQELMDMMVSLADATSRLTFKELCPPAQRSRVEAAKMFGKILGLHQRGAIYLSQKPSDGPRCAEIEIELKNPSIEHPR